MTDHLRARQVEVMADESRLQLLALVLRRWEATVWDLAGPGVDAAEISAHLRAMADVGILDRWIRRGCETYSPSPDALARFGGLLLGVAPSAHPLAAQRGRVERLADSMAADFEGVFGRETVHRYVLESYQLLAARATVHTHLPVLTQRFATDRLNALARAEGRMVRTGTDVLFVCVHNAARSQIAAALLRSEAPPDVRVRTAGSAPAARMDPCVATILQRRGLPTVAEFPKPLTDEVIRASDYVVTMGCGDACPLHPGPRYLDWQVPNPAGQPDRIIDDVIDQIAARVRELLASMA